MDRKGWIILILCGIGMMLTWNWMDKSNRASIKQQQEAKAQKNKTQPNMAETKKEQAIAKSSKKTNEQADDSVQGFTNKPEPKPQIEESFFTLTSTSKNKKDETQKHVQYTFTNKGGGIKKAVMLDASLNQGKPVALNTFGSYPIGALATGDNELKSPFYQKIKSTENSVTYRYTSEKKGIEITKFWQLAKAENEEDKVHPYRMRLTVSIKNVSSEEPIKLKHYSLSSGVAAPLFQDERADLCKWYYYQDKDFTSKTDGPFTTGFFGWGDAKEVENLPAYDLEYYGVANQFYTTLIQPSDDVNVKRFWVSSELVEMQDAEPGDSKRRIYTMAANFPDKDLVQGVKASYSFDIYTGPRKQAYLNALGANTGEAIDYGWFGFGAPIMSKALNWIHDVVAAKLHEPWSWGIAIIILTIFIRILIWPLHNKSTRTMKRMSKLQPKMKEIREKYSDNPQKVQQETLALYKKYQVNPMGGCLPILVQMPIFFAVFGMLTNAVELRGGAFLWVKDLSAQENLWTIPFFDIPLNILPFLMAGTMVLQMQMTPSTGDKLQRRIFMLMPILFFFFCYGYASALALYWTVQNIISIGQTWLMQRLPEPELIENASTGKDGKPRKKGFMEKMAEKMEEAQQQREQMMAQRQGKTPKNVTPSSNKTSKEKRRTPKTGG